MLMYILLVLEILLLNHCRKEKYIPDKTFCVIICVSFVVITGFRSIDVGSDTTGYYLSFNELKKLSLSQVILQDKRDIGYFIFAWVIAKCTGSFTILTTLAAVIFYVPLTLLIYRYSDDCGLSYLILMAFNFFQFSMTGIRQTIALGFAILFFLELQSKSARFYRTIIWLLLGTLMHRSCLLMLSFYLIKIMENNRNIAKVMLALVPIVFIVRVQVTSALLGVFNSIGFDIGDYEVTSGGGTTFFVYILLLIWGVFLTYKKEDDHDGLDMIWLTIFSVAVVLQNFVFVNSVLFRVVWYFSIYMIILIPKMIKYTKVTQDSMPILNGTIYTAIIYMYLFITIGSANVIPYSMVWW